MEPQEKNPYKDKVLPWKAFFFFSLACFFCSVATAATGEREKIIGRVFPPSSYYIISTATAAAEQGRPDTYVETTESFLTKDQEEKVKKAEPIFVRIDKFEESMQIFNDVKKKISETCYYHLCRKRIQVKECEYCQELFCVEHLLPKPPGLPLFKSTKVEDLDFMKEWHKINPHPMLGKPNHKLRILNKDPKFLKKAMLSKRIRPNLPEMRVIDLIEKNNLPFKYIGNGTL